MMTFRRALVLVVIAGAGVVFAGRAVLGIDNFEKSSFSSSSSESNGSAHSDSNCLADPSVLEDLRSQREKIAAARKELDTREAELKAREQSLQDEISKLTSIRDEIAKGDALHKKENEERVAKLIELIEGMSPKSAAKMIAEVDETLAVEVIRRMSTEKVAKIMNLIEPQKSSRLSEVLAGVSRARAVASSNKSGTQASQSVKGGDRKYDGQNSNSSNTKNDRDSSEQRQPASVSEPKGQISGK